MTTYDLIIRNGRLVLPADTTLPVDDGRADVGVSAGRIVAVEPELSGSGTVELDANGLHVFPGLIDAHVHFNEPGRTDWEGIATGSRALAAGGGTTYFDMPLNAHPPTLDAASFNLKLAAARAASVTDFALWGGLVPGNLHRLDELADRGVIGFKAFMSNSGIADFEAVDDLTLYEGMRRAADLGLPVAVHAENDGITARLARRAVAAGKTTPLDYIQSRPAVAELEAIQRAIMLAEETGCKLHIVHVSTGRGVELVAAARARGIDVSCETCPHYLVLTEDDLERLGAVAKCAPPLRPPDDQEALWRHLTNGNCPMVASDHSPAPGHMKLDADFFKVWGGISGCQSTLQLLVTHGYYERGIPLQTLASAMVGYAAQRFGLARRKGGIAVDADADLALVDLETTGMLASEDLFYKHPHSPYIGRRLRSRICRTLVRGTTVYQDGEIVSPPFGELVRPGT